MFCASLSAFQIALCLVRASPLAALKGPVQWMKVVEIVRKLHNWFQWFQEGAFVLSNFSCLWVLLQKRSTLYVGCD
jgi:hypothetical protein